MFGISSQALRDYAKWNIVIPERNNENNYRYYSELEVAHLIKARYLKAMGFSLAEVLEQNLGYEPDPENLKDNYFLSLKSLALNEWLDRIERRKKALTEEIRRIERVYQKVQEYGKQIENTYKYYEEFVIETSPGFLFLEYSDEENEMICEKEELDEFRKWVDAFPHSQYAFLCKKQAVVEDNTSDGNGFLRGLCVKEQDAELLNLSQSKRIRYLPPGKCIHAVVGLDFRLHSSARLLKNVADFAHTNNLTITGDAIGIWIAHFKEEKGIWKYYEVWIPVQ